MNEIKYIKDLIGINNHFIVEVHSSTLSGGATDNIYRIEIIVSLLEAMFREGLYEFNDYIINSGLTPNEITAEINELDNEILKLKNKKNLPKSTLLNQSKIDKTVIAKVKDIKERIDVFRKNKELHNLNMQRSRKQLKSYNDEYNIKISKLETIGPKEVTEILSNLHNTNIVKEIKNNNDIRIIKEIITIYEKSLDEKDIYRKSEKKYDSFKEKFNKKLKEYDIIIENIYSDELVKIDNKIQDIEKEKVELNKNLDIFKNGIDNLNKNTKQMVLENIDLVKGYFEEMRKMGEKTYDADEATTIADLQGRDASEVLTIIHEGYTDTSNTTLNQNFWVNLIEIEENLKGRGNKSTSRTENVIIEGQWFESLDLLQRQTNIIEISSKHINTKKTHQRNMKKIKTSIKTFGKIITNTVDVIGKGIQKVYNMFGFNKKRNERIDNLKNEVSKIEKELEKMERNNK